MKVFYKHFFDSVEAKEFVRGDSIKDIVKSTARCNEAFLEVFISDKNKLHRVERKDYELVKPNKNVFIQAIPGLIDSEDLTIREYQKDLVYNNILPYTAGGAVLGAKAGLALTGGTGGLLAPAIPVFGIIGGLIGAVTGLIVGGDEFNAKQEHYKNQVHINADEKLFHAIEATTKFDQLVRPESKQMEKELISNTVSRGSPIPEVFGTMRIKANRITPFEETTSRSQREDLTYYYEMVLSLGEGSLGISELEMDDFTEDNDDQELRFSTSYSVISYVNFSGDGSADQDRLESSSDVDDFENSVSDIPSVTAEGTIFFRVEFEHPIPPDPPSAPDRSDYPDYPDEPDDIDPETDGVQAAIQDILDYYAEVQAFDREVRRVNENFQDDVNSFQRDVNEYQDQLGEFTNIFSKVRSASNNLTALVVRSFKNPFLNNTTINTDVDLAVQTGITGADLDSQSFTVTTGGTTKEYAGFSDRGADTTETNRFIGSLVPDPIGLIEKLYTTEKQLVTVEGTEVETLLELNESYARLNPDLVYIYIDGTRYSLTKLTVNTYSFEDFEGFADELSYTINLQFSDGTFLYTNPEPPAEDDTKVDAHSIAADATEDWTGDITHRRNNYYVSDDTFLDGNNIVSQQFFRDNRSSIDRTEYLGSFLYLVTQGSNTPANFHDVGFDGLDSEFITSAITGSLDENWESRKRYDKVLVITNSDGDIVDILVIEYRTNFQRIQAYEYEFESIVSTSWFRSRYNFTKGNLTTTLTLTLYSLDTPLVYDSENPANDDYRGLDALFGTTTTAPSNPVTINTPTGTGLPNDLSTDFLNTNNPAWICLYILKEWYDRSQFTLPFSDVVDINSFTEWGNYCASNNLQFNGVFDYDTTVFDALSSVASVSRCRIVIGEEKIRAVIARAQSTIKQYFHSRNILEYEASFDRVLKPHALRGNFLNSEKGYFKDSSTVYFEGFDESSSKDIQSVSTLGLVTKEEVDKHLNLIKMVANKELLVFSLVVGLEALVSKIGDFVGVNFDEIEESMFTTGFFGVVKNEDGMITGFQIDQKITADLEVGSNYVCQFLKDDNTTTRGFSVSSVDSLEGEENTLTDRDGNVITDESGNPVTMSDRTRKTLVLENPISEAVFNALGVEKGDLILFGKTNTVVKECLIKEITVNEDFTANVLLVEYDEEVYEA